MQPGNLALDKTVIINETVSLVLTVKHTHKTNPACSTLEAYNKTHIFIPVDITENVVKLVMWELLGI